jgi:hypothetical protein
LTPATRGLAASDSRPELKWPITSSSELEHRFVLLLLLKAERLFLEMSNISQDIKSIENKSHGKDIILGYTFPRAYFILLKASKDKVSL